MSIENPNRCSIHKKHEHLDDEFQILHAKINTKAHALFIAHQLKYVGINSKVTGPTYRNSNLILMVTNYKNYEEEDTVFSKLLD